MAIRYNAYLFIFNKVFSDSDEDNESDKDADSPPSSPPPPQVIKLLKFSSSLIMSKLRVIRVGVVGPGC